MAEVEPRAPCVRRRPRRVLLRKVREHLRPRAPLSVCPTRSRPSCAARRLPPRTTSSRRRRRVHGIERLYRASTSDAPVRTDGPERVKPFFLGAVRRNLKIVPRASLVVFSCEQLRYNPLYAHHRRTNPPRLVLDALTHDIVRDGGEDLGLHVLQGETSLGPATVRLVTICLPALCAAAFAASVRRAALEEVVAALGVLDVLDADVNALPSDATTDLEREEGGWRRESAF